MATCTMYKIVMNGVLLPDIYFSWDAASAAFKVLKESSGASVARIVLWDDQTGEYN